MARKKSELERLREEVEAARLSHQLSVMELEQRAMKEALEFIDTFVDPRDAFRDPDGGPDWIPVGGTLDGKLSNEHAFRNEQEHAQIRARMREMAVHNPLCVSAYKNLVAFSVGKGLTYKVTTREKAGEVDPDLIADAQDVIDEFTDRNGWCRQEQENVKRHHRDGEWFLRYYPQPGGFLDVRIVEPAQVSQPNGTNHTYGIETEPGDVKRVVAYWIDGDRVEAEEVLHAKSNVDANVKRGLPTLYPARQHLDRAIKLLRNMSAMANTQAAIAMVRKYPAGTRRSAIEPFVDEQADYKILNTATQRTERYRRLNPGTVLDGIGVEYEFPHARANASAFVEVYKTELRTIAALTGLAEHMFSADASNANYSSTLIAQGSSDRISTTAT